MQWNLPEVQAEQRDAAEYLLGISEETEETPEETPDANDSEDGDD